MYTDGLVNAKNTAPHLKLKSLELYFCNDLETLQLLAPNLISFKFQGRQRSLFIKDAKQLASLRLSAYNDPNTSLIFPRGKNFIFSQFSSHIPKLESLVVTADLFKGLRSDFTELCVFSNLKQLVLEVFYISWTRPGYLVVASIIRAAPFLELLEIILPGENPPTWWRKALELASMSPPHQNLKEVKLSGFRGDKYTMEFLAYLVE